MLAMTTPQTGVEPVSVAEKHRERVPFQPDHGNFSEIHTELMPKIGTIL
jgi:hypothetical protein